MKKLKLLKTIMLGLTSSILFAGSVSAAPMQFNGHYYELIDTKMTYNAAKAYAATLSHNGLTGHLVTITSQAENDFVYNNLFDGNFAWLGASDQVTEGVWKWETGPEADTHFWQGGTGGGSVGGNYENWQPGSEPNNLNDEDAAHMWRDGYWNDNKIDKSFKFFVEYSPSSVPDETSTLCLMASGLLGIAYCRRQMKK